jgi:arylformamidase
MPTYPGEAGPSFSLLKAMADGDPADVSAVAMGLHTGTHVDAPCHFLPGAGGVESHPLDALLGPCDVLEINADGDVTATQLAAALGDRRPERVLLRTRNSIGRRPAWSRDAFDPDFAALQSEAARLLIERDVRLVGIDYLSVEPFAADQPLTHLALLGAGVVIVEGLDLRRVPAGSYELLCLPVVMAGRDGAPARVLLRATG